MRRYMMGQDDAITALVMRGACIDLETSQGRTALIMASISGDTLAIRTLVAAGADPNYENGKGYTALGGAVQVETRVCKHGIRRPSPWASDSMPVCDTL